MITDPLSGVAVVVVAAMVCQVAANRLRVPSVLFLLVAGVSLSSVLDPDEVFGELLFTTVGIGVAILLFEGGTSLNWSQLKTGKAPVLRLVTVGALVAWISGAGVAVLVLDGDRRLAVLVAAILIVSGPTVVIPLLEVVRPRQPTAAILRWEGILIDPIGAAVGIVVLDAIIEGHSVGQSIVRILITFGVGGAVGLAVSGIVIAAFRRQLVPDHLQVPFTLAVLLGAYATANVLSPEAGLIAATILGMAFANQRRVAAAHIAEFNENLGAVVLGALFIVLGARVNLEAIAENLTASLAIIAVLVLVARPLTVMVSTIGTPITWRQRGFLMVLAPRGVVAAAVASLFALELDNHGIDSGPLVPVVFTVVVGTVTIAAFLARFAADRLKVARPDPNGVILVGGGDFALDLADLLNRHEIPTLQVGGDGPEADRAEARGHQVYRGRLDTEQFVEAVETVGVLHAVALSGREYLDGYALEHIARIIGTEHLYGIDNPESHTEAGTTKTVAVQSILPAGCTAETLAELASNGAHLATSSAHRPRPNWLTIGRINDDNHVMFDPNPSHASGTDLLVQFGPTPPDPRLPAGGQVN